MWQKMQPFIQTKVPNTPLGYWLCGLKKNDVRLSCSRWGTCCDNAVERSFFATSDCQAECNISLKTSLAVLYFRTFLGLSQISSTACRTSSSVTFLKSLPLGEELAQEPVGVLNC